MLYFVKFNNNVDLTNFFKWRQDIRDPLTKDNRTSPTIDTLIRLFSNIYVLILGSLKIQGMYLYSKKKCNILAVVKDDKNESIQNCT